MDEHSLETYRQYLLARHLSEALLMKHSQESSKGKLIICGKAQVDEAFRGLAQRLGYRVERIEAPAATEAA